jgi:hypothetical protein
LQADNKCRDCVLQADNKCRGCVLQADNKCRDCVLQADDKAIGFTKTELRPGYNEAFLELFSYPPDRRLCVIFVLKEYLSRTEKLCGNFLKIAL